MKRRCFWRMIISLKFMTARWVLCHCLRDVTEPRKQNKTKKNTLIMILFPPMPEGSGATRRKHPGFFLSLSLSLCPCLSVPVSLSLCLFFLFVFFLSRWLTSARLSLRKFYTLRWTWPLRTIAGRPGRVFVGCSEALRRSVTTAP